ncbi:MmgE/PrpD family protein [Paraferrimonas sedimenticola]|uniref:2-methylcitrate dehydratase PrpD n=1 Tax=Paraferrimonas sedimenticola TaxID=375674 RepID=A0AA37RVY3_9GAMM|nr:MmgE/PrpD family protein [Paraferrimonas sedimenticola]GLP96319.1 hypothetical protein GCM10007895_16250 [Paraferrimonas sedimenticola]
MSQHLLPQVVQRLGEKPLNDNIRERAAWHLLDWLGCAAIGKDSPAGHAMQAMASEHNGHGVTRILASDSNWVDAISHNAAIGNVLEMDDIHRSSILHPGPVVVPVALAMAQYKGASMATMLEAIVLGYEINIRLGKAIGRSHYQFFHNTSTCGSAGAAMAAAHVLGLSPAQTVSAIANAVSRTGGLWQMRHENCQTKQWHNAEAARSGAQAAVLAEHGLSGPASILEGSQGWFNAMSKDAKPEAMLEESEHWLIEETSFKPWPACRHAHPSIDACLSVKDKLPGAEHIESIVLEVYRDAKVFCDNSSPQTELQAKFSIQHGVAAALVWGEPELEHYQLTRLHHPEVVAIRNKVVVQESKLIERAYPNAYGAKIKVIHYNGEIQSFYLPHTLGDPERPMSPVQLRRKAETLMAEAKVGNSTRAALTSLGWSQDKDLDQLTCLIGQMHASRKSTSKG